MVIRTLAAAALAAILALPAHAFTVNITGEVIDGTFAGEVGTGTIVFDPLNADETGLITNLSLSFNIFGQDFTEADDIDIAFGFPFVTINDDGFVDSINFFVSEDSTQGFNLPEDANVTDIVQPGVIGFSLFGPFELLALQSASTSSLVANPDQEAFFEVIVDEVVVPVPAALPMMAGVLAVFGLVARRRRAN